MLGFGVIGEFSLGQIGRGGGWTVRDEETEGWTVRTKQGETWTERTEQPEVWTEL